MHGVVTENEAGRASSESGCFMLARPDSHKHKHARTGGRQGSLLRLASGNRA